MPEQFAASIIVANEYTLFGTGTIYGMQTIGATAQEIKVGASALVARTTVSLQAHPDNTGIIYIGLDNTVTGTKWFQALIGGAALAITLDAADAIKIWAYASAAGQLIGVIEGID